MKISVIIPTYKPKEYLWTCLDSLYSQTLDKTEFEIILILNGCNQPWNSNINKWISDHSTLSVKLIQTDEGGVSNARNIGISYSQGEYVTFIDDDDYVSPSYLENLLLVVKKDTVAISDTVSFYDGIGITKENSSEHKAYIRAKEVNKKTLFHTRSIFNGPCMKLIPSSFVKGIRFNKSLKNGEDSLFMFAISRYIQKIEYAPEAAVYYRRIRPNSATTSKKTIWYKLKNYIILNHNYISIYFRKLGKYDTKFFLSRIAANTKTFIVNLKQ